MRYFPKLDTFKNAEKTNTFDGKRARSYGHHVYAQILSNGDVVMAEDGVSPTTRKHMRTFKHLVEGRKIWRVCVPHNGGMADPADVRAQVLWEMKKMKAHLENKRNRKMEWRRARMARLEAMLPVVDMLDRDNAGLPLKVPAALQDSPVGEWSEWEKTPAWCRLDPEVLKAHPQLEGVESITEVSRVLFGIKGMGKFVSAGTGEINAINTFFEGNSSDLAEWGAHASVAYLYGHRNPDNNIREWACGVRLYATPAHRKAYKLAVKLFGIKFAVRLTQEGACADTLRGLEYLRADKKRWARFEKGLLQAMPRWPEAAQVMMLHDYAVRAMQRVERRARRAENPSQPREVTLPQWEIPREVEVDGEIYKVMVPRHAYDMRRIGNAQNHCVGTANMGYIAAATRRSIAIVAIYRKNLADGICVEFSMRPNGAQAVQAQGRLRRCSTAAEDTVIATLEQAFYRLTLNPTASMPHGWEMVGAK